MNKSPKRHVGRELRILSNMLKRRMDASSLKHTLDTLTGTHGYVLKFLTDHCDSDVFQRDFEAAFSIRPSTASLILQRMEKNGLISRESVDYDARLKKIVLTQKAIDLHRAIHAEIRENERCLFEGISPDEQAVFFSVIDRMKENLENKDGAVSPLPNTNERKKTH